MKNHSIKKRKKSGFKNKCKHYDLIAKGDFKEKDDSLIALTCAAENTKGSNGRKETILEFEKLSKIVSATYQEEMSIIENKLFNDFIKSFDGKTIKEAREEVLNQFDCNSFLSETKIMNYTMRRKFDEFVEEQKIKIAK